MEENIFQNRTDLREIQDTAQRIKDQISTVIVGQQDMINLLIAALLADGHVLIEGPPGVAKTLAAKLMAKIITADFNRIQFTPDLMPSDVLGTSVYDMKTSGFVLKKGPVFSNVVLIDEINRAPAKTQSALFEVMEERQITMEGTTHSMGELFIVLATQNPLEQEGTYRLPEAQLDRFIFKINVPYPSEEEEFIIIQNHHKQNLSNKVSTTPSLLTLEQIVRYRNQVKELHIEEPLMRYIARIVASTRKNPSIFLGASPRASLAISAGSKAIAAIKGRDFVTPEDIQEIAPYVLCHRIQLSAEKEMEGTLPEDIIRQIVKSIEVPR